MIAMLDALFLQVRSIPFFYRFTLFLRILLAAGFVPTGWVKLMGRRFSQVSVETPIGAFFEAMYQTGGYWQFIGASQILAGLLLLSPVTAHLGALLFLPIIVNIFVVTVALGFTGTWLVTGLMLVAVVYLCCWDYPRWRSLVTESAMPANFSPVRHRLEPLEASGFWVFGLCLVACFLATRGGVPMAWVPALAVVGLGGGLFALVRFITHGRHQPA